VCGMSILRGAQNQGVSVSADRIHSNPTPHAMVTTFDLFSSIGPRDARCAETNLTGIKCVFKPKCR